MESSAYEALITAINVFIFIIALTAALSLMGAVNEMSDIASEVMKGSSNSLLAMEYQDNDSRTYSFKDLIAYNNYINKYNSQAKVKYGSDTLNTISVTIEDTTLEDYIKNKSDNIETSKLYELVITSYNEETLMPKEVKFQEL